MAEFGARATELSGPSAAGAQVLAPVQKDPLTFNTSWLAGAGNAIETFLKGTPAVDPSRADIEDRYAKRVSEFQQALDQGFISPSQFAAKRASLFSEITISAGEKWGTGLVYQRLGKLHSATADASGVSEAERQAKAVTDARTKLVTDAVAQGIVPAHVAESVGDQDKLLAIMQDIAVNDEKIKRQTALTDAQIKMNGETRAAAKDARDRVDYQRNQDALSYLSQQAPAAGEAAQLMLDTATEAINKGGDPKFILADSLNSLNKMEQRMMQSLTYSKDAQASVKASFDGYRQLVKDGLDPTKIAERDAANQKIRLLTLNKGMMDKDPALANIAASAQLLGPNVINTMVSTSIAADFIAARKNQPSPSVLSGDTFTQTQLNKVFNVNMKAAKSGEPIPKERLNQTAEGMNSVFKALGKVTPDQGLNISKGLELMASPATAELLKRGAVDPDSWTAAMSTYRNYVQKDMYEKAIQAFAAPIQVPGANGNPSLAIPLASQIKLTADSSGNIQVQPEFTHSVFTATAEGRRAAIMRMAQIRSQLAGVSMILRIESHAAGTSDYNDFLEKNGATMFPDIYTTPAELKKIEATGYRWNGGPKHLPSSYTRIDNGNKSND